MANGNLYVVCVILLLWTGCARADLQSDVKECSDKLQKLTACLDFVGGKSKAPTNDCCSNLKEVRAGSPKCLCVLIKDSTNPALGLQINQSLALEMPGLCKVDGKLSDCPAILHISPSSPDAKIFEGGNSSSASPPSAGSASKSSPGKAVPTTVTPTDNSFGLSLEPQICLIGFLVLIAASMF